KRSFLRPALVVVTMLAAALAATSALAGTRPAKPGNDGFAKSTTVGGIDPQFLPGARTIAHWSFRFTDPTHGVTYPITMVGSDLGGDTGQYGDVFMRSQFNKIGSGYHVKLSNTTVLPTVTIDVPQNQGVAYVRPAGATAGIADITWFSSQLQGLINSLHIDATTVPIFVTHNVLLYIGNDYRNCCVLGYHGAGHPNGVGAGSTNGGGNPPVQTFIYAAYTTPNTYSRFDQPT